jgi:hypothetical protein
MRAIIIILLCLFSLQGFSQRISDLTFVPAYDGLLQIPVDRPSFAVHRKIQLSTIATYIDGLSAARDTLIWARLDTLEADVVWEAGTGADAIQAISRTTTAATGDYALAHGVDALANLLGSRAYSSGSGEPILQVGWGQVIEFTLCGETVGAVTDTLLIGCEDVIAIPNNYSLAVNVHLLAVGTAGKEGNSFSGKYAFHIKQRAGTTTISDVDTLSQQKTAGFVPAINFVADDINERLVIQGIGDAAATIKWFARLEVIVIRFE